MTNADKFKNLFGIHATELWSMPEKDFLKWLNNEVMNCSEIPNNSDTISRQAAIDALDVLCQEHRYKIPGKWETYSQYNEAWQDALDRAENAIFKLPSAEPEQYLDSIVSEIEKTIRETRESGKHHEIHIRTNGEMICYGLQLALEIIEEKRNERSDKQTCGD